MKEVDMKAFAKLQPKKTKSGKTRSQIGKSAKAKGKSGERYFVNILNEVTKDMDLPEFYRVPNSGAFVGQQNRDKLKKLSGAQYLIHLGDIVCPDELKYQLILESKNYAELDFHNLINPKGSTKLLSWLDEMLYDVESALMYANNKTPLGFLCVKITRKGSWIVLNGGNWVNPEGPNVNWKWPNISCIPTPYIKFNHHVADLLKQHYWNDDFYMCDFQNFIEYNKESLFCKEKYNE